MKKTFTTIALVALSISLSNCSEVKDTIDESRDALECANKLENLEDDDSETCEDTIRILNEIEQSCGEFLNESSRESIAQLRAACASN